LGWGVEFFGVGGVGGWPMHALFSGCEAGEKKIGYNTQNTLRVFSTREIEITPNDLSKFKDLEKLQVSCNTQFDP